MAGPLTLRSGGESRLDGAPDQLLPPFADAVEALAQALLADDVDGAYAADINLARLAARQQLQEMSDRSRAGQAAAAQAGADRNRARAARQGVVPESLPMDEYGGVSARTVRTANMSPEDQEAEQAQYDGLARDEIRAMREGRFHGAEAQARQYAQDYGLPTTRSKTGKTDLDYIREIQEHQGFVRLGSGELIPRGRPPTPEAVASRRDFNEWANETPGTERQARYDPVAYAEWQEARAQEIQDNAREEMATYGTGSDDPQVRADTGLAPLTLEQIKARARRARGEQRRRDQAAAAAARRQQRLENDPKYAAEVQAREVERKARRARVAEQAQMAGGQPTGGPFGTRATTAAINQLGPGWREIALLDRLTNGRVGGPTPLAVEAANAAAAAEMAQQAMVAFLRNNPGATPEQAAAARQQVRDMNPAAAGAQDMAGREFDTPEAQAELSRLAESLDTSWGGMSYDNEMAMAAALQRPPYNLNQSDAEEMAYRYSEKRRWFSRPRGPAAVPDPTNPGGLPPGMVPPR